MEGPVVENGRSAEGVEENKETAVEVVLANEEESAECHEETEIKQLVVPKKRLLTKSNTTMRLERFLAAADAAQPMQIEFRDMVAKVPEGPGSTGLKTILHSVGGKIKPGELVALMGPSGAGKSTLLNVLGGRFDGAHSGLVLLNGKPRTKKFKKHVGYVLQTDFMMPNLTVRETLEVTAFLRLPQSMSLEKKRQIVDDIIHIMGLTTCENTLVQMVSGGESKRVSIANEMLMNPSILFLDEPTSGLDSTAAFSILSTLEELCRQGRTVICAIHQPSSQMFAKFHKLLLLASGKVIYSGRASEATAYFERVGFPCPVHYNPADFILELVTDSFESENEMLKDKDAVKAKLIESWDEIGQSVIDEQQKDDPELKTPASATSSLSAQEHKMLPVRSVTPSSSLAENGLHRGNESKWATNWFTQFKILYVRSFKHRRGHIVTKSKTFELLAVATIGGLIYFRMSPKEENAQDWIGATFFIQIYLAFMTMYRGVVYFPMERSVIQKERRSGAYRLSAYYLSKIFSEIPVDLILPFFALTIYYWLAGFGDDAGTYFLYLLGTALGIWTANAFGTFLGCAIMDFERALTGLTVVGIGMMLLGGFYVKERNIPDFIAWLGNLAHFKWAYALSIAVIVKNKKFKCQNPSAYKYCETHKYISAKKIVDDYGTSYAPWLCVVALLALSLGWNLLAYLFLRKNTSIPSSIENEEEK